MGRYIIGEVSSGKTRQLLEEAKKINAVVVCKNPDAMRVKAQNYGLYRLEFYSYEDMDEIPINAKIVVDELHDLFAYYGYDLVGFNMTTENA